MGVAPFPRGGRTKKLALGVLSRGGTIVCRRKREQDGPIAENRGRGERHMAMAGYVRPLREEDVTQVADLYVKVLGKVNGMSSVILGESMSDIFLKHPWYDEALPSLVYQEDGDKVVGCIGVMPWPMSFNGKRITAAISHSFIVDPESRSALTGIKLAKRFLSGPQDLSLTHGNNAGRRIWERLGGSTSLLHSLCWTRPLRPTRYALSFLSKRGIPEPLAWTLRPVCQLVDAVTTLSPKSPFRLPEPRLSGGELDASMLRACLCEATKEWSLCPEYDEHLSRWLFEMLAENRSRGTLEKLVLRNAKEEAVGWYLYYRKRRDIAQVVQIGARENHVDQVLDHLFYHAKQHGAIAVSGQVDPVFFEALSRKQCLFHQNGSFWMLVHSRHPGMLQAVHRGDAFLSRLEGDWWISF